ncbi:hypothetical protein F3Y22_tig00005459pilonHSYRG00307 [Hibiscus syriacus]|uniref:Uncharacterized protein n=1 Tax=Hibiscus syriacus TaxID=106335 RepID=A0A6A3CKF6_HIBSY|nr:hypothetical protein F3Y22_tig00005459pilonHSYRG00307 [Hibiscus syriacus]
MEALPLNLKKKDCKIVVAVDESEESMYALSWCLCNLISQTTINNLILLYVKPPPPVYSSLDVAGLLFSQRMVSGYIFSGDVIRALETYGNDLANSVMGRAQNQTRYVGDGSHGYGFFKRALLGSVSDHCTKHVKCRW